MIKYFLKYINADGEGKYTCEIEDNHTINMTDRLDMCTIYYGKPGLNMIYDEIKNDIESGFLKEDDKVEIEAKEKNGIHHFEYVSAIADEFGQNHYDTIDDDFDLGREANPRPKVNDLNMNEIIRYYFWKKKKKASQPMVAMVANPNTTFPLNKELTINEVKKFI